MLPPHDDDCTCLQCFQAIQKSLGSCLKVLDDLPEYTFGEVKKHPLWAEIQPLLAASHRFRPCVVGAMYCHHPNCGRARWEHEGEVGEELLGACPSCGKQHPVVVSCK